MGIRIHPNRVAPEHSAMKISAVSNSSSGCSLVIVAVGSSRLVVVLVGSGRLVVVVVVVVVD